jgi:hypothetical protein
MSDCARRCTEREAAGGSSGVLSGKPRRASIGVEVVVLKSRPVVSLRRLDATFYSSPWRVNGRSCGNEAPVKRAKFSFQSFRRRQREAAAVARTEAEGIGCAAKTAIGSSTTGRTGAEFESVPR